MGAWELIMDLGTIYTFYALVFMILCVLASAFGDF